MDIPSAGRWILTALAAVQLGYAVRALRPALRSRPGARLDAWLAFADPAVGVPVTLALALGNLPALLAGLAVLGPVLACRLYRTIAARRTRPTAA
ncbi:MULTISPECIES: hypothetical protein [unclassified Streptomyces]|uniref:hypothetical protein n=1 Tax=unclassified Streptomyces TaxID=2593676 RepID=UPI0006200F0D|nr:MULTISPECIES: hypothetical protein [unclassified Streptomyces]KJY39755.1 hypothetical protein VR46_28665 [Streptomyces sp. NRRL S-444]KOY59420.1 hypothetical protein ADK59_03995 [Streptomyces sp. XY332]THA38796.1 hypothetical protein E6W17_14460 [Streptomyces sp. A1547]